MKRLLYALIAVVGLALTVVGTNTPAGAQSTDNPADVAAGKAVYATSCAGCHGADGTGVAGLGRPLIGIASQGDRDTHIASITDGKGGMPAFGDKLSADEIAQSTSYVRLTFVEAAAESGPAELAVTGVGSTGLTIIGMSMLISGWLLVAVSKPKREDS